MDAGKRDLLAILSHLEQYDEGTRSAVVVFVLEPKPDALRPEKGMLCRVEVNGTIARRIYRRRLGLPHRDINERYSR